MKKIFIIMCICVMLLCSSCKSIFGNKIDKNEEVDSRPYTYGMIKLPNGEIVEGTLDNYILYSNDVYILTINKVKYRVNTINCILIGKDD